MKLLDRETEIVFEETGSQENVEDPLVIAKFFNPAGAGTWYAIEYYPEEQIFYGFVSIHGDDCDEWGTFSLKELQTYKGSFGLGIERDVHCGIKTLSEHLKK